MHLHLTLLHTLGIHLKIKNIRDLTIFNDFFEFTQIIVGLKLIIFNHKLLNKNIQVLNLHSYNINTLLND